MRTQLVIVSATVSLLAGCASHIAPYRPKRRHFDPGRYEKSPVASRGSLYAGGAGWFEDDRAGRVGDILIVRIEESEQATRDATTKLARSTQRSASASGLLGSAASAVGLDSAGLIGLSSERTFDGSGKIERKGRLVATLPVRVRRVLPNGDLFVEGTKVIMVGAEEHHLYVSGLVRPVDIGPDNTISSTRLADAEIEYTGRGDVTQQTRQGWLARLLDTIMPF
ncbi:MAG: flagellar basal body L-ring protein FlgH [Deltaproteobacteria bacterium]|nr:MAG: flagellar basal body L-ring protein FlgH [Deltaproteobacteria bacterium]